MLRISRNKYTFRSETEVVEHDSAGISRLHPVRLMISDPPLYVRWCEVVCPTGYYKIRSAEKTPISGFLPLLASNTHMPTMVILSYVVGDAGQSWSTDK